MTRTRGMRDCYLVSEWSVMCTPAESVDTLSRGATPGVPRVSVLVFGGAAGRLDGFFSSVLSWPRPPTTCASLSLTCFQNSPAIPERAATP